MLLLTLIAIYCGLQAALIGDEPSEEAPFVSIFDGETLDGWRSVPEGTDSEWSVQNGTIVGEGTVNRLVYLVYKDEEITDFELTLQYRLPGEGNTGVEIRAQTDESGKRPFEGYHADLGHVGIGDHILGAWDFHFAERREPGCPRGTSLVFHEDGSMDSSEISDAVSTSEIRAHDWNDVHVVAQGRHFQFYINGKIASEFTDNAEEGRLDHGAIGLQIHDKGMRVEFRDIRLRRLDDEEIQGPTSQGTKYLLLDSRNIESVENAILKVGTVRKHESNPLFAEDQPWEPRYDNVYANVIYDENEQLYKCWYSPFVIDSACTETPHEERVPGEYMQTLRETGRHREMGVCYATSEDGIRWTKPMLDIRTWDDDQPTNIVDMGPHGAGIMLDSHETDPERRYKMFMKEKGVSVEFSPDGLHWSEPIRCPEIDAAADTHNNAFWAPELERYVGITRLWGDNPRERIVGRTESTDFIHWTKAVEVFRGDPSSQIYAMPVFQYAGVYIGLPVIFQPGTDRSHTELAWSSDTVHWHRIDPGTSLIPTSPDRDAYDWGCVYAADEPIILEDEIRLYYGASDGPHTDWRNGFFALATLRPDGFAGYEPEDDQQSAMVETALLSSSTDAIRITADASNGSIVVTVVDASGNELAASLPITSDVTNEPVRFPEGFSLDGLHEPVRLRFEINTAKVYSFSM